MNQEYIPLVAVPVLNRGDLLKRFVTSIDTPVARLLLINNGRDPSVLDVIAELQGSRIEMINELTVVSPKHNLGVATSWNVAITEMLGHELPYAIIAGSDIKLAPGDLDKFHSAYEPAKPLQCGNHGYSLFMITPEAIEQVGGFDENFYPAYLEDRDYAYRLRMMGFKHEEIATVAAEHGETGMDGSCTIRSDPTLFRLNSRTHCRNLEYYKRKWGGENGSESFRFPFGNEDFGMDWWEIDLQHRVSNSTWPEKK